MDKVEDLLVLFTKENLVFKPTHYKLVYQVSVIKHISIFYKITIHNDIKLLRFWNSIKILKNFHCNLVIPIRHIKKSDLFVTSSVVEM